MHHQSSTRAPGAPGANGRAPADAGHKPPARLAVVGRVSTRDQEQYGTSLEDQAHKGALLAQLHSMEVVPSDAYQGDESGALPLEARPIMQRLISDAHGGSFDAVCFHKIDRIARRLSYILQIWDALTDAGVTVYIIEPAIDTSTIMGRLLRNVLGTIAEFERDLILERTAGGRAREMDGGAVYAPRGKYGYQYQKRDRANGVVPHVKAHPEHADVVRRIFRLRANRWSPERIANLLTAEGKPTPAQVASHKKRGERWHTGTVRAILLDRSYMGEGEWGASTYVRDSNGKRRRVAPPADRAVRKIAYPALVTREEWHAANAVSRSAGAPPVRATADQYLLYGGMLRCAEHDHSMGGSADQGGYRRYRCARNVPGGGRTTHGIPAADLDTRVWGDVCAAMLDSDRMVAAAMELAREAESGMEGVARRRAEIAARLGVLEEQLRWVYRDLREAGATPGEIAEQARLVREEQARLHAEAAPLAAQMALHQENLPRAEQIAALCQEFTRRAADASAQTKRELLEALEVEVVLEGSRYRIDGVLGELGLGGEVSVQTTESLSRFTTMHAVPFRLSGALPLGA